MSEKPYSSADRWPSAAEIISRLRSPRGALGRIPCPAHGGEDNNLSIRDARGDGPPLVFCHSHNCPTQEILDGLRRALGMRAFRPASNTPAAAPRSRRPRRELRRQALNKSFGLAERWWSGSRAIDVTSPAGKYLISRGVLPRAFPLRAARSIKGALARPHFKPLPPTCAELLLYRIEDYADSSRFIGVIAEAVTLTGDRCPPTPRWSMKRRAFGNQRRGVFRAGRRGNGPLIVTEGAIDALAIFGRLTSGTVVGLPGTSGFERFGRHLARNPEGPPVVIEADGDPAGLAAADKLCRALFRSGRKYRVVTHLAGVDPAAEYAQFKGLLDYRLPPGNPSAPSRPTQLSAAEYPHRQPLP